MNKKKILYEVNLKVKNRVIEKFLTWEKNHIQEMLQFSGFQKADLLINTDKEDSDSKTITAVYTVESMEHLEDFFNNHATRMRSGLNIFGSDVSAYRRVFEIEDSFNRKI
jgi:hypothetical protein